MSDIGWLVTYDGRSGGNRVRHQVMEGLSGTYSFDTVTIEPRLSFGQFVGPAWNLATYSDPSIDLWIENIASSAVRLPGRRGTSVVLLHHLPEPDGYRSVANILHALRNEVVLRRLREADRVIVVSDFWESFLAERGVTDNVVKVYNGLPVSTFDVDRGAVREMRNEVCEDPEQPLVHVGPCAPGKGGDKVYEQLAGMDATLVTTGRKDAETPVKHYDLPYREYLTLLAACDVLVAMSEIPEGWGLQAQEAMLCRTPVVGSGRGGMGMLLEGGGQVVCPAFEDVGAAVEDALARRDQLGEAGYEYAKQFTLERMLEGYRSVFETVLAD